jgi:DNA (cytosine-5)-methyltransferase 1
MKVLDLFAGAGGFSLGFQNAGYKAVGAIELDSWACETLRFNHPDMEVLQGDISTFSDKKILETFGPLKPDVIVGGPPCQGFSICNKNAGDAKDPRNSLFVEFLRVGKLLSPTLMIMENVPNLLKARTQSGEPVIDIIKSEMADLGYHVYHDVLEATSFGVPQIRKRLFVVACKHSLQTPFPAPTHVWSDSNQVSFTTRGLKKCPTLWEAISDLPKVEPRGGSEEMEYDSKPTNLYQKLMRAGSPKVFNHLSMKHSKRMIERFASMSWGQSVSDVPEHLKPLKRSGNGEISGKAYDQNNRRMHPDKPCHTIPASFYANFVHPYIDRNFTAREGARLQSFPDWYVFKGKPTVVSHKLLAREERFDEKFLCQYNQIGNAVPPLMAQRIAEHFIEQGIFDVRSRSKSRAKGIESVEVFV